ncbi:MAG TPA: type II toxin-antitoxin system VapC family toxin [Thermoanaerobaculia bacterium]|nr:type II toxin-antitoxin system VapC family toxin [Thermoanaerobaculia bacterium]
MPRLYLETSVVSYLTARPSTNIITAAHQLITARWWAERRADFELLISELVLEEAARGDADAAAKRLEALEGLSLLRVTAAVSDLAGSILRAHLLPAKAFPDALHIATASVHAVEYLLTWNCSHIANAELLPRVTALVEDTGFNMPFVCTPEELLGEPHDR